MRTAHVAAALAAAMLLGSCGAAPSGPAELWTDLPELVLAAELFNSSQDRYLVEMNWAANLPEAIRQAKEPPALAVGRYLKGAAVRDRLSSLDYLFSQLAVGKAAFYPGLLALGNIDGRQLLLPVSFNLPAIVFPRGAAPSGDGFLLGLADMAPAAAAFNRKGKGGYARMGFSPRWDGSFLVLAVNSAGAGFKEGKPLAWNDRGLSAGIEAMRSWVALANGSAADEDEFQFKYLYTPAYQYLGSGRALFAYVDSSAFFTIPEDKRASLDYRWFAAPAPAAKGAAAAGAVPVSDDLVYAALPRGGSGKRAAEAFLKWFFREDSQAALLERSSATRAIERSFGVVGGFSSLRSVNERVLPRYYPSLVGHQPPAESLVAPNVLPSDWPELKSAVVEPWLVEVTAAPSPAPDPGAQLAERIADYRKRAAQR